jgi:hypothetical protein
VPRGIFYAQSFKVVCGHQRGGASRPNRRRARNTLTPAFTGYRRPGHHIQCYHADLLTIQPTHS